MTEPENRCVFHGTTRDFEQFDESLIGSGKDCNSALGFHFADDAADAAEYAESWAEVHGGEGRVVVIKAATMNPAGHLGYYEFFGYDQDGRVVRDHEGFRQLRGELRAEGYDAVDYEDGEQRIFLILDLSVIEIVAVLTPEEARTCAERIQCLVDPEDDAARFDLVQAIVDERPAPAPR